MTHANWDDPGALRRAGVLASDSDRDLASQVLIDAFGQGRLTQEEFEERSGRGLSARTHGELDAVLTGLGGFGRQSMEFSVDLGTADLDIEKAGILMRRVMFWLGAFFALPFVFFGVIFVLAGSDFGDRVFGIILTAVSLPSVIGLYRWSHPKQS